MRFLLPALGALMALCLCIGCNTAGCLENRSSVPLAGFYSYSTGEAIVLDSVTVTGIGESTPLYKAGSRISSVYLPMRSTMPSTQWELAYKWTYLMGGTLCDTISFDYTSEPFFASDECGVVFRYHITRMTYTRHLIDSIAVTDSLVSNTDIERIKIFFRTSDE